MKIKIRQAEGRKDAEMLETLAREIWQEHYTPIIGIGQVEYMLGKYQSADRIAGDIDENGYTYYIAESDGSPEGYCAVRPENGGTLFLSKLYVHKKARGNGIAGRFMTVLESRCRAEGHGRIRLTVNKNNSGSIAAYQKLGVVISESIVTDIGGGFVMDDYVMFRQV